MKRLFTTLLAALVASTSTAEEYARIDRATMTVLEIKRTETAVPADRFDAHDPRRATFWVPVTRDPRPAIDPATHKLVPTETITTTTATFSWNSVALTPEELARLQRENLRRTTVRTRLKALIQKFIDGTDTAQDRRDAIKLLLRHLEFDEPG